MNNQSISVDSTDILVLQGDDRLAIERCLTALKTAGGNDFGDLNFSRLDGTQADLSQVSMQVNMLPLGLGKRILVVDHAYDLLKGKDGKKWLQDMTAQFSPSAFLVLVLDDEKKYHNRKLDWIKIKKDHWIRKSLSGASIKYEWQEFPLPTDRQMPEWIIGEAKRLGGNFHPAAAHTLSTLIGNNLFQAKQEIEKAIAYAGVERQVTAADIRLLCAKSKEDNIFALVDAVGMRDGKKASGLLQELGRDMPLQYVFTMFVRQLRLLVQTKIVLDNRGGSEAVLEACEINSEWQAKNLIKQANRFSLAELENMYKQLDMLDEQSKIGQISLEAALESLVASIMIQQ